MSVSLPSREAVIIDVPEVRNFSAVFVYNFFVPDEAVNGTGDLPLNVKYKEGLFFDSSFINTLGTRLPRYVQFNFSPIIIPSKNKNVSDKNIRDNNIKNDAQSNYITKNYSKILDEDFFASDNFTAINLSDQSIDKKLFNYISGAAVWMVSDIQSNEKQSHKQLALETNQITSDNVDYQFLSKYLVQPSENGTFFFEKNSQRIRNDVVNKLKDVKIHVQINNKFLNKVLDKAVTNPQTTFNGDFVPLLNVSKSVQQNARNKSNSNIGRDDYKVIAEYVSISKMDSATSTVSAEAKIVGYVIDKNEFLPDGTSKQHPPIIIENPLSSLAIDTAVKYYSNYVYSVRTIAEFTMPAIIDDTGELVAAKILISSRPTQKINVNCTEVIPPPSPTDFNFHWNFTSSEMNLLWTFPPNSQRDIKKFQVFRRSSIREPFQLIKVYDFDDSIVKAQQFEIPTLNLVEKQTNPSLMFTDVDFTKDSKFIYALASIDAHGITSNYSDQFEVSFDRFKNRLIKKRISSSGAPKSYPNMYLDANTFVDMIVDKGHRSVEIVFDPDHLSVFDSANRDLQLLATSETNSIYKVQFINLDLQQERILEISIDDLRTKNA